MNDETPVQPVQKEVTPKKTKVKQLVETALPTPKEFIPMEGYDMYSVSSHAVDSILPKMQAILDDFEYMRKIGKNTYSNYTYLMERQVTEQLKKLCSTYKVFTHVISQKEVLKYDLNKNVISEVEVVLRYVCTETGQFITSVGMGKGADTLDKDMNKAITAAIKYIHMKNFNIPTGDDPEADSKLEQEHARELSQQNAKVSTPERQAEGPVVPKQKVEVKKEAQPVSTPVHAEVVSSPAKDVSSWTKEEINEFKDVRALAQYFKAKKPIAEKEGTIVQFKELAIARQNLIKHGLVA